MSNRKKIDKRRRLRSKLKRYLGKQLSIATDRKRWDWRKEIVAWQDRLKKGKIHLSHKSVNSIITMLDRDQLIHILKDESK